MNLCNGHPTHSSRLSGYLKKPLLSGRSGCTRQVLASNSRQAAPRQGRDAERGERRRRARLTNIPAARGAVAITWKSGASGLFVGPNQIRVADAEGQCQFIDRYDRRISSAFLQAADVLLAEPGNLGKLLLRQTLP